MNKYMCAICGYVYDPAVGDADNEVAAGTAFSDVPDTFDCPQCGASKNAFDPE